MADRKVKEGICNSVKYGAADFVKKYLPIRKKKKYIVAGRKRIIYYKGRYAVQSDCKEQDQKSTERIT